MDVVLTQIESRLFQVQSTLKRMRTELRSILKLLNLSFSSAKTNSGNTASARCKMVAAPAKATMIAPVLVLAIQQRPFRQPSSGNHSCLCKNNVYWCAFLGAFFHSFIGKIISPYDSGVWTTKLFTAIDGKGAFLNGKPIKVSSQSELVKSLLGTEAGTNRDQSTLDAFTKSINYLLSKVRALRWCGSSALDLCGIACGRLDLFYQFGFGGPWDVAAGAVIVKEAGGVLFDPSGKEFDITSQRIAASNEVLKDLLVEALKECAE